MGKISSKSRDVTDVPMELPRDLKEACSNLEVGVPSLCISVFGVGLEHWQIRLWLDYFKGCPCHETIYNDLLVFVLLHIIESNDKVGHVETKSWCVGDCY